MTDQLILSEVESKAMKIANNTEFSTEEIIIALDSFSESLVMDAIEFSNEHNEIKDRDIFYWCIQFLRQEVLIEGNDLPLKYYPLQWKNDYKVGKVK